MHHERTTKRDDDGQGEQTLDSLEPQLTSLLLDEPLKAEISELENGLANVCLDNDSDSQEEEDGNSSESENKLPSKSSVCSEPKEEVCEEEEDDEKLNHPDGQKEESIKTAENKKGEDKYDEEKEKEEIEEDKEIVKEELKDNELQETLKGELKDGEDKDDEESQNKEDGVGKEDSGRTAVEDATKDSDHAEKKRETDVKSRQKNLVSRGLLDSSQYSPMYSSNYSQSYADSQYMYPAGSPQQAMTPTNAGMPLSPSPGYMDSNSFSPMDSNSFSSMQAMSPQHAMIATGSGMAMSPMSGYSDLSQCGNSKVMSPQQAMTPTSYGMALSPLPGYTEPLLNGSMWPVEGSGTISDDSCWMPESPYSLPDESENLNQGVQAFAQNDYADVIAAIGIVESSTNPIECPQERVIPIMKNLLETIEDGPPNYDALIKSGIRDFEQERRCLDNFDTGNMENFPQSYGDNSAPSSAAVAIMRHLKQEIYIEASRKMALKTNEEATAKDDDGDHPCMILACQEFQSTNFLENLCAGMKRVRDIKICCEKAVNMKKNACVVCGNTDQDTFYSPLAMYNIQGDTVLKSAIRQKQPELVIHYIIENVCRSQTDINRVFGGSNAEFYRSMEQFYPILRRMNF